MRIENNIKHVSPEEFQVREDAGQYDEVARSVADDLVCKVNVPVHRVFCGDHD